MSFTPAREAPPASAHVTEIKAALRFTKSNVGTVRVMVPKARFNVFSGSPIGRKWDVRVGRDNHAGVLRLEESPSGKFEFRPGIKESLVLSLAAWDTLPREAHTAGVCSVRTDGNAILIDLPAWARGTA